MLNSSKEQAEENYNEQKLEIALGFENQLSEQREKLVFRGYPTFVNLLMNWTYLNIIGHFCVSRVLAEIEGLQTMEASKLEEMKEDHEKKMEEMRIHYVSLASDEELKFKKVGSDFGPVKFVIGYLMETILVFYSLTTRDIVNFRLIIFNYI